MRTFTKALVALAVLAGVAFVSSLYLRQQDEWEGRVRVAEALAAENLTAADSLLAVAIRFEDEAIALAIQAEQRDTVIIRMIEELPAPPSEALPYTEPRDSVIAEMAARHDDISAAYESEREAAALLRLAEGRAHAAADSLMAVLDDRPIPRPGFIPEVGFGVTAGVCTTGQPCVAVGVTLSWKVRLF